MKNEKKKRRHPIMANVIINIHGDNTQVLPNATEAKQILYGVEFARAKMQINMAEEDENEAEKVAGYNQRY